MQYSDFNRYIPSRGTMTWDLGQTFTGTFRADGQLFYGKMIYVSGDTYEGPFENGKRSGNGTYTGKNGERATGTFIDGKMNGQFVRTKADGFSQKETWRMGKFMSDRALANEAEEKRFAAEKRAAELADAKKRALEAQKFRERIELIENHRKNKIEQCLYAEVKNITNEYQKNIIEKSCQKKINNRYERIYKKCEKSIDGYDFQNLINRIFK